MVELKQRRAGGRRRILLIILAVLVVLAAMIFAASWFLSAILIDPHHDLVHNDVNTIAVRPGQVVLENKESSTRQGVYGLDWGSGHAVVGPILSKSGSQVTRRVLSLTGSLTPGTKVGVDPQVWQGDPQQSLGIPFRSISYPDPLGPMPAWVVSGRGTTWAIFVHGIDGTRSGGLRPLTTLHRLGLPTMLIDYRNDVGAPASPDHHIHLGMTEWQDLEAAVRWAMRQGAQHFVLYGDSMGGSIVTRFMRVSSLSKSVYALVLDAPALNWGSIINNQASRFYVPFMGPPVQWVVGWRIGFDWSSMNEIANAHDFPLPILLFQGLSDKLVPPSDSQAFAKAAIGPVTYVTVPGAGHIQSWNANPPSYESHLGGFLARWAPR